MRAHYVGSNEHKARPLDPSYAFDPRTSDAREWPRRHNLFTCREGMAYPDLTLFRKEDEVMLC